MDKLEEADWTDEVAKGKYNFEEESNKRSF